MHYDHALDAVIVAVLVAVVLFDVTAAAYFMCDHWDWIAEHMH